MNGKWTVGAKLAEGACGEVYELQETDPAIGQLVVKCIALPNPKSSKAQQKAQSRIADTLYYENVLYTNGLFHGFIQSAKVPRGAYGEDHGVRYLVMERLGLPLSSWATLTGSVTPAKVATIGLQILAGLEFIHNKGYVYIDIKPDNFMIKVTNNVEKLYFIDFGLMEKFMSVMSAGHREMQHRNVVAGTAQFVSVDVQNGSVPSRKDDIEAMAYLLLSLTSNCNLPWASAKNDIELRDAKASADIRAIAEERGCPMLADIVYEMRGLVFSVAPDYNRVRFLLEQLKTCKERKSSSASAVEHIPSVATAKRASKERGTKREAPVADSTEHEEEPIEQPKSVATARRGKVRRDLEATPLILEPAADINPRRAVRSGATAKKARGAAVAEDDDEVEDQMLRHRLSGEGPNTPSTSGARTATRRGRAAAVAQAPATPPVSRSSRPKELILLGIKGPYEGSAIPIPLVFTGESGSQGKTKRKGKAESSSEVIAVGRGDEASSGCAIALGGDEYISERHIEIRSRVCDDGTSGLSIRDIGSSNGTKINGVQVKAQQWTDVSINDIIKIGVSKFYVKPREN